MEKIEPLTTGGNINVQLPLDAGQPISSAGHFAPKTACKISSASSVSSASSLIENSCMRFLFFDFRAIWHKEINIKIISIHLIIFK